MWFESDWAHANSMPWKINLTPIYFSYFQMSSALWLLLLLFIKHAVYVHRLIVINSKTVYWSFMRRELRRTTMTNTFTNCNRILLCVYAGCTAFTVFHLFKNNILNFLHASDFSLLCHRHKTHQQYSYRINSKSTHSQPRMLCDISIWARGEWNGKKANETYWLSNENRCSSWYVSTDTRT